MKVEQTMKHAEHEEHDEPAVIKNNMKMMKIIKKVGMLRMMK